MRDYEPKKNGQKHLDEDLEGVLNSALAIYATIEARAGLEERILANLRAQQPKVHRTLWAWAFGAAVLALLIVAIALRSTRAVRPDVVKHPAVPEVMRSVEARNPGSGVTRPPNHVRKNRVAKHYALPLNPKLDQFPSPHPLSEQEQILAMYINQYPEHAALIAEARMEALREDDARRLQIAEEDSRQLGR